MTAPILAISGPSGSGKTRLLARLVPALARRGVTTAVVKHTRHRHPFDRPGKDTEVLRRAGALATAIEGPEGMALFGPPAGGLRQLARLLPPVDLVLAEGFRGEPVPRVEVHRRSVSKAFLCARDPRVIAIVTDEPPPRPIRAFTAGEVEGLADAICARFGLGGHRGGPRRLRRRAGVSTLRANRSERTALGRVDRMAKTTKRKSGARRGARGGRRSSARGGRSAAGRKGGQATLRARGPEFYSEIGRKGGRSRSRNARRSAARGSTRRGSSRAGARSGRKAGGRSMRRSRR